MKTDAPKLLLDTNVLLDVLLLRTPFYQHSMKIFEKCIYQDCTGIIAAHSITNMFYILKKHFSPTDLRTLLLQLTDHFEIAGLEKENIIRSLHNTDFPDFEDCLQDHCASDFLADYIITRNTADFSRSTIPAITPEEYLNLKPEIS